MPTAASSEENVTRYVIVITGASSGFGALTARALARAGHTVYATMRETTGRNAPPDADVNEVAEPIVRVVDMPFGRWPFRTHVDPSQDGAEIASGVADRARAEMFRRTGIEDLLSARIVARAG